MIKASGVGGVSGGIHADADLAVRADLVDDASDGASPRAVGERDGLVVDDVTDLPKVILGDGVIWAADVRGAAAGDPVSPF